MESHVVVVTPVYRDWECFQSLLRDLANEVSHDLEISVIAVDDASGDLQDLARIHIPQDLSSVQIVQLKQNVGHQRAIAIGLAEAQLIEPATYVCVMDADGEDPPRAIRSLIKVSESEESQIVVASRGKRHAGFAFGFGYTLYKRLLRILTGQEIDYGNFSLVPKEIVPNILASPTIWSHYAATIANSRSGVKRIRIDRDKRYFGSSKMSFSDLTLHGVSAIAVFTNQVLVRLIAVAMLSLAVCAVALLGLFAIRSFTSLAIPGWATIAFGLTLVLALQLFSLLVFALFFLMGQRSRFVLPLEDQLDSYVAQRITLIHD